MSCFVIQHAVTRKWMNTETLINDLQLIVHGAKSVSLQIF